MKPKSKDELTKWAMEAQRLWLFLDYDGTLAEFAPTPDHLEPNPRLIRLLDQLARQPALRLTILSGRRLGHIRRLLPLSGIFMAGSYGIELLTPGGETVHRVDYEKIRPFLERIKPQWEQSIGGRNGFYLEDKGWAMALHARFAEDTEAGQVLVQARQAVSGEDLADGFRILGGHKFLEIAPSLASKRDAVAYLLDQYPLPEARLLYIGDDDKDEEAFSLIHAKGGVAVKVRQPSQASQPTEADFFLESPKDTIRWLETLANLDPDP